MSSKRRFTRVVSMEPIARSSSRRTPISQPNAAAKNKWKKNNITPRARGKSFTQTITNVIIAW